MTANKKSKPGKNDEAGRLDDQLCFALYAASNAVTRVYRPLLTDLGLTYPQYLVMLVLWEHGTRRLGEIADELELATHAVSPILDRLEESGLVWTPVSLDAWLQDPAMFVVGTKMAFTGYRSAADRRNLIAYLLHATK